ncbi:hypothetical protein [Streptomyces mutomycini]|uniref:hypothetical protein n=1 Tax=Streptomyces mutomycini TaxID=284036 RepID=UPI0033DF4AF1
MSVYDKLMNILDNTQGFILDEMWPDSEVTLDDIALELLCDHTRELVDYIRDHTFSIHEDDGAWAVIDLLNPGGKP